MAVHDDTLNRLVEDVLDTRADVVEQAHRISKEVCRPQHPINLGHKLLSVVQNDSFLQRGHGQTRVVDDQSVEADWRSVDVTERHSQCVEEEDYGVTRACPGVTLARSAWMPRRTPYVSWLTCHPHSLVQFS